MNLYLKALGLTLLAVLAIGAMAVSTASAETLDHFTSSSAIGKTTLTGEAVGTEAENVFGVKVAPSFAIHCKNSGVKFHGTMASNSVTEVTVHPTYSECSSNLGALTINTTGCNYILSGTTDKFFNTTGVEEGKDATMSIECEAGKAITLMTAGCTISIGSESGGKAVNQNILGVKYTNELSGGLKDVKVDVTTDKTHYTTNDAFSCTIAGIPTTGTDGFLTGKVTVKGYEDNGTENKQAQIEVS